MGCPKINQTAIPDVNNQQAYKGERATHEISVKPTSIAR